MSGLTPLVGFVDISVSYKDVRANAPLGFVKISIFYEDVRANAPCGIC